MDLFHKAGLIELRGYQQEAVDKLISYLRNEQGNPIVCAATGTGKSVMIGSFCQRVAKANAGARVMVASHVAELLRQNADKLRMLSPQADIGFYSAGIGERDLHNQFVFAGIQSIYRADVGHFNVLAVDEVHTISKKDKSMWATLIGKLKAVNPRIRIVGFSATPFRLDSGSLTDGEDSLFDTIIYDYGLGRAISDGYLCPITAKYTSTVYNIEGVGKVAGDYNLKQLEEATNLDYLTRQAVEEMIEKGKDRKSWLIFCNGVAHSFAIRDEIRKHGITCETVTGETPDNERQNILEDYKSGKVRAVTNNAVWTTGIDVPFVDLIGMFRHTMSGGLLLQMAGRGTRVMCNLIQETPAQRRLAIAQSVKPNCLFLDFAKNIERHGFLDTITAKTKGKKGEGVAPMKPCPECATICHAAAAKCKDCGYEFPKNEVSIIGEVYDGAVLSQPIEKPVSSIFYSPHNVNKEGKIPSLRVRYDHPDKTYTCEYVCLQHEGFAGQKAHKWWDERDGATIRGATVEQIYNEGLCEGLKIPSAIVVGKQAKNPKFDEIKKYINLHHPIIEESTDEAMEEMFGF